MAEHAEGSTEVFATPAEVLAVVADFEAYPDWVAGVEEVEVRSRDRRGRGTRVAFRLRTPLGEQAYTLEPAGDGATLVTYRLEVDLGMPLPGLVKRQAARQIVRSALADLKRRVESM